jgi:hypothetical protein
MFKWLEEHSLPCAYKTLLGIECPLCGSQRAFFFLVKGEFAKSFSMYPPLIPVLALLLLFMFRLFNKRLDIKHVYRFSVVVLIVVAVNYSVKLIAAS